MSLFTETVTLIKRGAKIGEDEYGRPEYGPSTRTTSPAWFEAGNNTENTTAREQYETFYTLYLPASAALQGADSVELPDGRGEYHVQGDVGFQPGGFVVEGYKVAKLVQVKG